MDKQQKLYESAASFIGIDASPLDGAPDEYGCAESVSHVIRKAFPELKFPILISTRTLYNYLLNSPSFKMVFTPELGAIIVNVTGTGNGVVKNGHCGIVGKQWIMSNDSRTGTWEANYLPDAWERYFAQKGGMQTHYFVCV